MWNAGSGDSNPHVESHLRMDPARVGQTAAKAARRAMSKSGIYVAHDRIKGPALRAMLGEFARGPAQVVPLAELRHDKEIARGWCRREV